METTTLQTFGFAAHFSKKLEDGEFAPFLRPRSIAKQRHPR